MSIIINQEMVMARPSERIISSSGMIEEIKIIVQEVYYGIIENNDVRFVAR